MILSCNTWSSKRNNRTLQVFGKDNHKQENNIKKIVEISLYSSRKPY